MALWRGGAMLASLWLVACAGSSLHEAPLETRDTARASAGATPSPAPDPALPVPPPLPSRGGTPPDPVWPASGTTAVIAAASVRASRSRDPFADPLIGSRDNGHLAGQLRHVDPFVAQAARL